MFDVGFWELVVIFVVGLLVLGPQRLPQVASQLGRWAGQARGMARILKQQLREELGDADPRRIMNAPVAKGAHTSVASARAAAGEPDPAHSGVELPGAAPAAAATEDPPAGPPAA